jgi:hypothetical protein
MAEDQGPGESGHAANTQDNPDASRRRRIGKWIAGVAATVVAAVIVAVVVPYFSGLGKHVSDVLNQPGGSPVKVDLVALQQGPGQSRVIPRTLALSASQLASLNSLNETTPAFQQWFAARGAVAVDGLLIELVVQGNRDAPVRIINMQPLVSCHAPLTGTLFYSPPAGADTNTQLILNLDHPLQPPRYIANVNGQVGGGANYFEHFTVSLKRNEQFTFLINAYTARQYCEFSLKMTVLDGSRTLTETVSDNGKPFQVTSIYNENDVNPGAFARYRELYVGGVATAGLKGSGQNQFGSPLWLHADPLTYQP